MRSLLISLAITATTTACTSTRQLGSTTDALRVAGHRDGWVVPTTEGWHERIDPLTDLQFQQRDGRWSEVVHADDLHVDRAGAWIDDRRALGYVVDKVRIEDVSTLVGGVIAHTQPGSAALDEVDPDDAHLTHTYVLVAEHAALQHWLETIVLDVARLDPVDTADEEVPVHSSTANATTTTLHLTGDDAKLYRLRLAGGAPLGHWALHAPARGWYDDLRGTTLLDAIDLGVDARVGWQWSDIAHVQVTNLSGGKTLGAIAGYSALAVVLAPFALVARGVSFPAHAGDGGGGGGGGGNGGALDLAARVADTAVTTGGAAKATAWFPELPPAASLSAGPLFARGARFRAYADPTLALDTSVGYRGDLIATGAIARVRLAEVFEIGGGVREVASRSAGAWSRSTTGVFTAGVHAPLDAGMHFAIPLGLEVSHGGEVGVDFRVPWGLRYTHDHYFITLSPATPAYLHLHDAPRRWSFVSSLELGYAL